MPKGNPGIDFHGFPDYNFPSLGKELPEVNASGEDHTTPWQAIFTLPLRSSTREESRSGTWQWTDRESSIEIIHHSLASFMKPWRRRPLFIHT